jgi:hypothetical protein
MGFIQSFQNFTISTKIFEFIRLSNRFRLLDVGHGLQDGSTLSIH